jgi:hypothetical protein
MIQNNQTKMLNSILNRYKDRIVVDRLIHIDQATSEPKLLVDPEDVLNHSPEQYVELQKKRNYGFNNISDEWKTWYDPIPSIDDNIYNNIMDIPSEDEWFDIL